MSQREESVREQAQAHQDPQLDEPLPIEPGHVMRRQHYEKMVRDAQQGQE